MQKGRKKIINKVVAPEKRKAAYDFIRERAKEGEQVFVICPRIETTDNGQRTINNEQRTANNVMSWADVKAVKTEYEKLSKKVFPDLNVGMLHGKMKTREKEKIMKDFRTKKCEKRIHLD